MIAPSEATSPWKWGQAWLANAKTLGIVAALGLLPLAIFRWSPPEAFAGDGLHTFKPLFLLMVATSGAAAFLVAGVFALEAAFVAGRRAHGFIAVCLGGVGLLLLDVALSAGTQSLFDDVRGPSLVVRCGMAWGPAIAALLAMRSAKTTPLHLDAIGISKIAALFVAALVGLMLLAKAPFLSTVPALQGLPLGGALVSMVVLDRFARTADAELGRRLLLAAMAVGVLEAGLLFFLSMPSSTVVFAAFAFLCVLYMSIFVWGAANDVAQLLSRLAHAENDLDACGQQLLQQQRMIQRQQDASKVAGGAEAIARLAAHDLREPLRKIRSFGDRLERHASGTLDTKGRDFLQRMQGAAERMQEMVDGLIACARIEAAPMDPGGVNLETAVMEQLEKIREAGADVHLVGLEHLPQAVGNAEQIEVLLGQLFENALKFRTESTVKIDVRAEATARHSTLHIADNGVGFEPSMREEIFSPFKRLHGRAYSGSGLGLSLCRGIAEHAGGSLTAAATPNNGATFTLQLPRWGAP